MTFSINHNLIQYHPNYYLNNNYIFDFTFDPNEPSIITVTHNPNNAHPLQILNAYSHITHDWDGYTPLTIDGITFQFIEECI